MWDGGGGGKGEGRGCWCEEQNARGWCSARLRTPREAFPARSVFRCVRAGWGGVAARSPPRAKLPIKALVYGLSFVRNPA